MVWVSMFQGGSYLTHSRFAMLLGQCFHRPGRKKNGTRAVIARLNYEIFLWRAHAQNDLRRVFQCPVIIAKQKIALGP